MATPESQPVNLDGIDTEDALRAAVVQLLGARDNVRALAADTGLSKSTLSDIRNGRRRVTRRALTRIASRYEPGRLGDWVAAWERVNQAPVGGSGAMEQAFPSANAQLAQRASRRPSYRTVAAILAAGLIIESVAVTAFWWSSREGERRGGGVDAVTSSACVPARMNYRPGVTDMAGAVTSDLGVGVTGYFLRPGSDPPSVEVAAQLIGTVPDGNRLLLFEWADPTTFDSTPEHNPGNGRYYPTIEVTVVGDCLRLPEKRFGYESFAGITTRFFVVLVDEDRIPDMLSVAGENDGLDRGQYVSYEPIELAFFDVGSMELPGAATPESVEGS